MKFPPRSRFRLSPGIVICGFIFFLAMSSSFAAAADIGGIILPDYHHIDITTANGGTYYIKFDGGGLNALHITTSTAEPYGQITQTNSPSGTFYISDTGGRGFNDNHILMVSVKGTEVPDDYKIHITASGYTWAPTPVVNQPPSKENLTYQAVSIDRTFTKKDFIYGPQNWKPSNEPPYPIIADQDMNDPTQTFRFMFVDLKAGALGPNSMLTDLIDSGMVKVEYSITNPSGLTVFDVYAWCNQSNQGKGISWTNALTYTVGNGGKTTGGSGYSVLTGPESGDNPAAVSGGSVEFEESGTPKQESAEESGQLTPVGSTFLSGTTAISITSGGPLTLKGRESGDLRLETGDPGNQTSSDARFYLYASDGHESGSGKGAVPTLSAALDGQPLTQVRVYQAASGNRSIVSTHVFGSPMQVTAGSHNVRIGNTGPSGTVCTIYGGMLVETIQAGAPGTISWINEGCDVISPSGDTEETTTSSFSKMPEIAPPVNATLYLVSTGTRDTGGNSLHFLFNGHDISANNSGSQSPVEVRKFDVTGYLQPSGNQLSIQGIASAGSTIYTENRNAILIAGSQPANPAGQDVPRQSQYILRTLPSTPPATVPASPQATVSPSMPATTSPGTGGSAASFPGLLGDIINSILRLFS